MNKKDSLSQPISHPSSVRMDSGLSQLDQVLSISTGFSSQGHFHHVSALLSATDLSYLATELKEIGIMFP